jgi:hypothetical protein
VQLPGDENGADDTGEDVSENPLPVGERLLLGGRDPFIQHNDSLPQNPRVRGRQHAQHALQYFTVIPRIGAAPSMAVKKHVRTLFMRGASEIPPGLQRRRSSPRTEMSPFKLSDQAKASGGHTINKGDPNPNLCPSARQDGADMAGRSTSHCSRRRSSCL